MKIEIYEESKQPAVKPEEPLRLRLVPRYNRILLHAVRADGSEIKCGAIIRIDQDGTIYRCFNVTEDLKLPIDDQGRVLIEDE